MKTFILAICACALMSCAKFKNEKVTVIKDCTGTYLQLDKKDYQVCNYESLDSYADGTTVTATFKTIDDCKRLDTLIVCEMLHLNEGYIEVEKIK